MSGAAKTENIVIVEANENNLKNISVEIPLNRFTCVTGPSGCGKSSLVYDTIYAESQRNFIESQTGVFFGVVLPDKPKVKSIRNLRPALNIAQKYYNVNPRSTVGTVTDISYYLRDLFAFVENTRSKTRWDGSHFSSNKPDVWCPRCNGLGEEDVISEQAVIPDRTKKLSSGGIKYFKGTKTSFEYGILVAICEHFNIDIDKRVADLTKKEREILLYRTENTPLEVTFKYKGRRRSCTIYRKGVMPTLQEEYRDGHVRKSTLMDLQKYLIKQPCSLCHGEKLNENVRQIQICNKNIGQVEQLSITGLLEWISEVRTTFKKSSNGDQVQFLLSNIESRAKRLIELNLSYISLGRSIPSLSGGEKQRVRIAKQLDCSLSGLIYIFDEPCKGLHYKNIESIIHATKELIQKGNTVISIEHNKQFIANSDYVIELGKGGGPYGGEITASCSSSSYVVKKKWNVRSMLLGGGSTRKNQISATCTERKPSKKNGGNETDALTEDWLSLEDVSHHNLKGINVKIPLGRITCISGVSGSGKTSLADVIEDCCKKGESEYCSKVSDNNFKRVFRVNQDPIGKTPRSTVISYLEIYDAIRNLFAKTAAAKRLGLTASNFSMNIKDNGRCETCSGTGKQEIQLANAPETYICCPDCKGKRFNETILSVLYKGNNIDDILNKDIHSLVPVFEESKSVSEVLQCLDEIGMGYISLGQMSMNLSGGEAQRIKLARNLGVSSGGKGIYILDEPTSGLGDNDIALLAKVLKRLSDRGETVVMIEHNIEFISEIADYLIDLGNMPGDAGGTTVVAGDVSTVMSDKRSSWAGLKNPR